MNTIIKSSICGIALALGTLSSAHADESRKAYGITMDDVMEQGIPQNTAACIFTFMYLDEKCNSGEIVSPYIKADGVIRTISYIEKACNEMPTHDRTRIIEGAIEHANTGFCNM